MSHATGKFKIVRKLGGQSKRKFGEVFLLESPDGEKAVLKLVRKNSENNKIADRLRQEATFSFADNRLPNVLSFVETETETALVLEYREGKPLTDWAKGLSHSKRRKKLAEILEALLAPLGIIHENNIVHLDLKPDNLLVSETPSGIKISIIDFGMAMNLDFPEKRSTLFSLPYSSPELILNRSDLLGQSSDLFSLGMIIYHFLEQRLPFQSSNPSVYTNLQLVHPIPAVGGISKAQNMLLRELTAKPEFKTAPNLMPETEVTAALTSAMHKRMAAIDQFVEKWQELERKSFLQRIFR